MGQLAAGNATALAMEEASQALMVEMERRFNTKLAERDAGTFAFRQEIEDLHRKNEDLHHRIRIIEEEHVRQESGTGRGSGRPSVTTCTSLKLS